MSPSPASSWPSATASRRERGVAVGVTREEETHGYKSLVTVTTQTR